MILTAFVDLSITPASFDTVVFAVKAEIARRQAKADRLHVVFVPDPKNPHGVRDKSPLYDPVEGQFRLWNICIPACSLLGATVTLATDWEHARRLKTEHVFPHDWDRQTLKDRRHLIGDVITAARAGVEIPRLSASEHARRKIAERYRHVTKPVVTMTLRNTYLAERNSKPDEWTKARAHIESKGCMVQLINDTGWAVVHGTGCAEFNLDLRMAIYQRAALNLVESNGPASLCWFSDRPYRMFGAGIPAEEWAGLFVKQGLPLGENWPWSLPQQRLVYAPSTAENVIAEFEAWAGGN